MVENSKLVSLVFWFLYQDNIMDSDPLTSSFEPTKLEEMGIQNISISDQTSLLQYSKIKSDSFVVDMEHFSHPTDKDMTANSRIATLQRSLSRKGCPRGGEKRMTSNAGSERDTSVLATSSPRASFVGASTPEKSMVVTVGATDYPINPQVQHQITIMTTNGATATTTTTTESKWGGKRFNFRRSAPSWTIDPRRILIFFATLSSMGSILLIYFTLSMGKLSEDDNALN